MKKRTTLILLLMMIAGIAVLVYPSFSDYLNRCSASHAIYQSVTQVDPVTASEERLLAEEYNASLRSQTAGPSYTAVLNLGDGLMGSLEIPKIQVYLPIYHGTDSDVLAMGIGHLEGSALPIGGEGNHSVLTGHTGLPSAKLLTDLTELSVGDVFYIHVLQESLCYQVVEIQTVLPDAAGILQSEPGRDICTLVTCTPYGVNTHRLLVQGERTEKAEEQTQPQQQMPAIQMPWSLVAAMVAIVLLCGMFFAVLFRRR